jgi:hypothetical protein
MKFGTDLLEQFLIVTLAILTVIVFLVMAGGMLDETQLASSLTNMLLILVVGAQYLSAILLMRIYEELGSKRR